MASFQDRAKQFGYELTGASDIMGGSRKLGKATTFKEGLQGVGQIGYGMLGFVPGAGFLTKIPKLAKAAQLINKSPLKKSVFETVPNIVGKKGFKQTVNRTNPTLQKPRQFVREATYNLTTPRNVAANTMVTKAVDNQLNMGLNYQDPNKNLGTVQNKVTKQLNAIQPTYNPSGRKGTATSPNLFKGSFSTSGFPGLNVTKQPSLIVVQPNDPTLKPPAVPKPPDKKAIPPKTDNTRIVNLPGDSGSVTLDTSFLKPFEITPKQSSTQTPIKTPTTTGTKTVTTPSTTTGTTTGTTNTAQTTTPTTSNLLPNNFTGVYNNQTGKTEYVDLEQQKRDEAAKIALDKYNQSTYNDELQRNAALAEQKKFYQEQDQIAQLGALQQQKTQLENKTYGVPPYLEAANKRYQGGLARSQALGAIREQDIRDALSQRQMSARGRSAGIVGGLAPALLGSGLTGAGRSYKLDTRNEIIKRAEEQAALKESYDIYLAEAARQSQLEQLEDAKTRSLLVDQIRSLGSN